jgi:ABC-type transport system involved in multi-copper enzyme maturation permease subunit
MTTRAIRTVAISVFRESVRDKVLYNLVFFAVLLIAVSYLLSQLTAGQDIKVIKDLGLFAMSLFGLFMAVFIGIGLVSKEVEKRSIYSLLTKPIRRQEFIVGKYLGLLLTLFVNLAIMAVAYYGVLGAVAWLDGAWFRPHWEAPAVDPALLKAIAMIFLQLAIVVAIALFFSTFSSPMLSAALTFGLFVVGHFNADLKNFENVVDSKAVSYVARALGGCRQRKRSTPAAPAVAGSCRRRNGLPPEPCPVPAGAAPPAARRSRSPPGVR